MTWRDAADTHALRSDLTEALGGGLVDPAATAERLTRVLGSQGSAVFLHRDRKAGLRWLHRTGLAPGRSLDVAALARPLAPRIVPLCVSDSADQEALLAWWRTCSLRYPGHRGQGQTRATGASPSSWQAWRRDQRVALAFHAGDDGLRVGVLLIQGLDADGWETLHAHLPAMTASVVRQYWLTWRSRAKETLDAIGAEQFPVHLAAPAAANQTELMTRVARSADHLLSGIAAALLAPVAVLAMPDTTWNHVGRLGHLGFQDKGHPHSMGPAERGLSLRFCFSPARVNEVTGPRAFHVPDGPAMRGAYLRFDITTDQAPHGPAGTPSERRDTDRAAGFYPSDTSLEPSLCGGAGETPNALLGPWAYAAVPLDPWLWTDPSPQERVRIPHEARRHYHLESGDGCGVLKVQGRLRCDLLDLPTSPPSPFALEELQALDRWAPEIGRIVQRRIRQEEQALSDKLFEASVSALVQGGLPRFVALLQAFTQARCTALMSQEIGTGEIGALALSWQRELPSADQLALTAALFDTGAHGALGEAWLFKSQSVVGVLPGSEGAPMNFLKQPVTTLSNRRLALVWVGVPPELRSAGGVDPFPGVLRPALARVARLLHSTLMYQEATARKLGHATSLFDSMIGQKPPDYDAFAIAWKTLLTRLAGPAPAPPHIREGRLRFARDVAASFGQQGELARILGVESQTVRRHMMAIVPEPGAPPWRTLAKQGDVTQVADLTEAAHHLAQQV